MPACLGWGLRRCGTDCMPHTLACRRRLACRMCPRDRLRRMRWRRASVCRKARGRAWAQTHSMCRKARGSAWAQTLQVCRKARGRAWAQTHPVCWEAR
eukprot:scaffold11849_cov66-Phaeocystis_antarctica.AAC.1